MLEINEKTLKDSKYDLVPMMQSEISQCVDRSLCLQTEVVRKVNRAFPLASQ